ncbi:hypothetical protein Bca52824_028594 [Brassica carinata]|uniref:Uncharacterized protein n=1 Tax=Brassica carinata TaxID=52824 RepID=A0A8X7VCR3_BRACI|nr:hypothetical protein Bca52824_028594 [Brassica carinata]
MDGGGETSTVTKEARGLKKGPWTTTEDAILTEYVRKRGEGNWNAVQKNSGLLRCGKSCRLRWANHLRPNLRKGSFSPDEEKIIIELHAKLGNKWARMASQLPGRTDNEIKNYWNTRMKRRQRAGLPLYPHEIQHLGIEANSNLYEKHNEPTMLKTTVDDDDDYILKSLLDSFPSTTSLPDWYQTTEIQKEASPSGILIGNPQRNSRVEPHKPLPSSSVDPMASLGSSYWGNMPGIC